MANKISVLIDVATDKARSSIKSLRKEMADADTLFGKAKVGLKGGLETLKANAGAFAVSAGAALVAFGVKAIGAFQDTARAALELSKSTGLGIEEASRWIAVADDMGVSAGDLQTALAKLPKTLDAAKWAKYGIDVRDATGAMRPMNQILLDALDVLGRIPDETERAKAGADLLGRGFASLAPMVGKTRAEYEKMLGAVEDGQVITAKESDRAERLRLAQDKLADALGEVTLAVGDLLAGPAGELLNFLAEAITLTAKLSDEMSEALGGGVRDAVDYADELDKYVRKLKDMGMASDDIDVMVEAWKRNHKATTQQIEDAEKLAAMWRRLNDWVTTTPGDIWRDLNRGFARTPAVAVPAASAIDGIAGAAGNATRETNGFRHAYDLLTGELSDRTAWLDMDDAFADYSRGLWTGTLKGREAERGLIDLKGKMLDYVGTLNTIPPAKRSEIIAMINRGALAEAKRQLDDVERDRQITIWVHANVSGAGAALGLIGLRGRARGGRAGSDGAIAGENYRPELVDGRLVTGPTYVPPGSRVTSETDTAAMLRRSSQTVTHNSYVTVNMPAGVDPSGVARAIQKYARRNGTL